MSSDSISTSDLVITTQPSIRTSSTPPVAVTTTHPPLTPDAAPAKSPIAAAAAQGQADAPPVPPVRQLTTPQVLLLLCLSPLLLLLVLLYTLLALPCLLSGRCSQQPRSATVQPTLTPDEEREDLAAYRRSSAGLWLYQRAWLPSPSTPLRGVVFLVHGLAEHIGRNGYLELASRLTAAGYAVHGMDAQGHGRSTGERCYVRRWRHLVDDEVEFVRSFNATYSPTTPRVLFGHSLGGLVALHVVLRLHRDHPDDWRFAALVLSAPAAQADPKVATPFNVFLARVGSLLAPKMRVDALDPVVLSRSAEAVAAFRADEWVDHGGLRARFGREILRGQGEVRREGRLKEIREEAVLVLHGTADVVVPVASSRWVYEAVGSMKKRLCLYDKGYHEMFEDRDKDKFYDDILAFIDEHAPPPVPARQ